MVLRLLGRTDIPCLLSWNNYTSKRCPDKTLPVRLSTLVSAAFFGLGAIPTFLWIKEHKSTEAMPGGYNYFTIGFKRLLDTYKSIKQFKELIKFLIIFLIFNSGVMVVISFAAIYAVKVLNFTMQENIILILVVNITASIGAFIFGFVQDKIRVKVYNNNYACFMDNNGCMGISFLYQNKFLDAGQHSGYCTWIYSKRFKGNGGNVLAGRKIRRIFRFLGDRRQTRRNNRACKFRPACSHVRREPALCNSFYCGIFYTRDNWYVLL